MRVLKTVLIFTIVVTCGLSTCPKIFAAEVNYSEPRENQASDIIFFEVQNVSLKKQQKLVVPDDEKIFVLVMKHEYVMKIYSYGEQTKEYEISLSQSPIGKKEKVGDLKVPEGEYNICQKTEGPFGDDPEWKVFLGPRWIRINYPNIFDALIGLQKKLITMTEYNEIIKAINNGITPPQNTALGGGIGIHGWSDRDWNDDGYRDLTWGCVSMHNNDLIEFYDLVDIGTKIVILK